MEVELVLPFGDRGRASEPRPLHEAQLLTLGELLARYRADCPYRPGDFVTPRSDSHLALVGEPHVVLEVFFGDDTADGRELLPVLDEASVGSPSSGLRWDMVVGVQGTCGHVHAHRAPSLLFERYDSEATPARADPRASAEEAREPLTPESFDAAFGGGFVTTPAELDVPHWARSAIARVRADYEPPSVVTDGMLFAALIDAGDGEEEARVRALTQWARTLESGE